ncbi:MAG: hypothetical protein KGI27_12370 [Thaumarchaeota archaeon]|nr:hypothetical protein [Nitrososphaerota archaeon]
MKKSITFQALAEIGLMVLVGFIINLRFDPVSVGIISSVFGLAHVMAWHSNRRFLAEHGAREPIWDTNTGDLADP